MSNTAENPSPFDPLDKMPADEPRFILRGKDPVTPNCILEWATCTRRWAYRKYGVEPKNRKDADALKALLAKCREAEKQAFEISEWANDNAVDMGQARASYNDQQQTAEALAELERRRKIDVLIRFIQEGRFNLCEAKDGLESMGLIGEEIVREIQGWLDRAQQIADHVDPRTAYREPQLPIGKDA